MTRLNRVRMIRVWGAFCVIAALSTTAWADVRVGVTISGEIVPGVYGRVEIGDTSPPLVYAKPVIIVQESHREPLTPIYLHVPPGHAKNWRKYCGRYNACNRPVYFVKSAEYEPGYEKRSDNKSRADEARGKGKDKGRDH